MGLGEALFWTRAARRSAGGRRENERGRATGAREPDERAGGRRTRAAARMANGGASAKKPTGFRGMPKRKATPPL